MFATIGIVAFWIFFFTEPLPYMHEVEKPNEQDMF